MWKRRPLTETSDGSLCFACRRSLLPPKIGDLQKQAEALSKKPSLAKPPADCMKRIRLSYACSLGVYLVDESGTYIGFLPTGTTADRMIEIIKLHLPEGPKKSYHSRAWTEVRFGSCVVKTRRRASRANKSSFKSPFTQPEFFFDRSSRRDKQTQDCVARLRAAPPRQRGDVRLPRPRARCGAGARGLNRRCGQKRGRVCGRR